MGEAYGLCACSRWNDINDTSFVENSHFFGWGVFSGKRFTSKGVSTLSTVWLSQFKTIYWRWTISFKLANECGFLAPTVDWWRTLSVPRVERSNTVLFLVLISVEYKIAESRNTWIHTSTYDLTLIWPVTFYKKWELLITTPRFATSTIHQGRSLIPDKLFSCFWRSFVLVLNTSLW